VLVGLGKIGRSRAKRLAAAICFENRTPARAKSPAIRHHKNLRPPARAGGIRYWNRRVRNLRPFEDSTATTVILHLYDEWGSGPQTPLNLR